MPSVEVKIFTDGSALGNPGPGGFCAIIKGMEAAGKETTIVKGGASHTTNNRMEMSAVIAGLYWLHKNLPEVKTCRVFSDSQLVVFSLNHGWKRKKNLDLWKKLDAVAEKFDRIEWRWIRGHSGHKENTQADRIAVAEAEKRRKRIDTLASLE